MRRHIYIALMILLPFSAMAQGFPQKQKIGDSRTLVYSPGGIGADSLVVVQYSFPDTVSANRGYLKNIPGALIRVGNDVYMRNISATFWRLMNGQNAPGGFRLSPTLRSTPVLAGYDPDTGEPYYEDSVHHDNEPEVFGPNKFLGRLNGLYGAQDYNEATLYDGGTTISKSYHHNGGGFTQYYDSMGIVIRQKALPSGGSDTLIALYAGGNPTPTLLVTQSGGLKVNAITAIGGDFSIVPSSGMRISGLPLILSPNGSRTASIRAEQQEGMFIRRYIGVPNNGGINYWYTFRNDTINGGIYSWPTRSNSRPIGIFYTAQDSTTENIFYINAWGHVFLRTPYTSLASVDTVLVLKDGIITGVPKSDFSTGGGGSGTVTSVGAGFGITGGTITTTGTHGVDSTLLATRLRVMKSIDSIAAIVATKGTVSAVNAGWAITGGNITSSGTHGVDSNLVATKLRTMQIVDSITKARNIPQSFTSGTSVTVDYNARARFIGTISHNAVFSVSNMHAGEVTFFLVNGSGGPYTPTFPGGYQPILNPNTGDTTMVIGSYNGSAWYWSTNVQYTLTASRTVISATAGQTSFNPGFTLPSNLALLDVWRNGVYVQFTTSGGNVILPASTVGDEIIIKKTGN